MAVHGIGLFASADSREAFEDAMQPLITSLQGDMGFPGIGEASGIRMQSPACMPMCYL